MAKPDAWMPMYWGDYVASTGHLSTLEHGAYLLLIGHYWTTGNPLPKNEKKLSKIARISCAQWRKISDTILDFFDDEGDCYTHSRIAQELEKAKKKYEARARAGRAGGKAKAKQKPSNAKARLNQSQSQPQSTNVDRDTTYLSSVRESGFDLFWQVYPRKKAKAHALKAWKSAIKQIHPGQIIFAAEQYAERTKGSEARYIKHPATWLNGACWHDEPDPDPTDATERSRRSAILEGLGLSGPGQLDSGAGSAEVCDFGSIGGGATGCDGSVEADWQASVSGSPGSVVQFRGGVQLESQPKGFDADLSPIVPELSGGLGGESSERDARKLEGMGQTADPGGNVGERHVRVDPAQTHGEQNPPSYKAQATGATRPQANQPGGTGRADGASAADFPQPAGQLARKLKRVNG